MAIQRWLANQAPINCPQLQFAEGPESWRLTYTNHRCRTDTTKVIQVEAPDVISVAVDVAPAWRGFILRTDIGIPGRPVWFLLGITITRYYTSEPKPHDTPRTRSIWVATDGTSWYQVSNIDAPRSKHGRRIVPPDFVLLPKAQAYLIGAIEQYQALHATA